SNKFELLSCPFPEKGRSFLISGSKHLNNKRQPHSLRKKHYILFYSKSKTKSTAGTSGMLARTAGFSNYSKTYLSTFKISLHIFQNPIFNILDVGFLKLFSGYLFIKFDISL